VIAAQRQQPTAVGAGEPGGDDLAAFLATLAAMLQETTAQFERAASRVTELVVTLPGQTHRDLVVALQDFDRLNQEFSAIGEALARTGASMTGTWTRGDGEIHPKHEVIGAISVADLRDRLLRHLDAVPGDPTLDSLLDQPMPADDGTVEF